MGKPCAGVKVLGSWRLPLLFSFPVSITFVHQVKTERRQKEKSAGREIWAPGLLAGNCCVSLNKQAPLRLWAEKRWSTVMPRACQLEPPLSFWSPQPLSGNLAELTAPAIPASSQNGLLVEKDDFPAEGIWKFFQFSMKFLQHIREGPVLLTSLTTPSARLGRPSAGEGGDGG